MHIYNLRKCFIEYYQKNCLYMLYICLISSKLQNKFAYRVWWIRCSCIKLRMPPFFYSSTLPNLSWRVHLFTKTISPPDISVNAWLWFIVSQVFQLAWLISIAQQDGSLHLSIRSYPTLHRKENFHHII